MYPLLRRYLPHQGITPRPLAGNIRVNLEGVKSNQRTTEKEEKIEYSLPAHQRIHLQPAELSDSKLTYYYISYIAGATAAASIDQTTKHPAPRNQSTRTMPGTSVKSSYTRRRDASAAAEAGAGGEEAKLEELARLGEDDSYDEYVPLKERRRREAERRSGKLGKNRRDKEREQLERERWVSRDARSALPSLGTGVAEQNVIFLCYCK